MYGFASTARHDLINARMQRGGERILRLIDEGKHEEAQALMNADNWEKEGQAKDDETTNNGITKENQRKKRGQEDKQGITKDES